MVRAHKLKQGAALAAAVGLMAFAVMVPARADETFTAGSGAGSATLFGLNIPYGGANIGVGVGEANASYFESNATASAQSVNPGFIGLANLVKFCGEGFPTELPTATSASTNDSGGQPDVRAKDSGAPGVQSESAQAYPGSRGVADATGQAFTFPGLASMAGGTSHAEAKLEPASQARTVTTDVRVGSLKLLNGVVALGDLEWHLQQVVVGPDDRSSVRSQTATFHMGTASLSGIPLPTDTPAQLSASIDTINQAIRPVGLQLRLPQLVANGARGSRYTPLTVAVGGNTAYGKVLYPLIAGTNDTSLVSLFNKYTQPMIFDPAHCDELAGLLHANEQFNFLWNSIGADTPIVLSAFAAAINGGAEVDFDLGGTRTTVDDTYYAPRTIVRNARVTPPIDQPTGDAPVAPRREAAPATPAVALPSVVRAVGGGSSECHTISPVGSPGCWRGAAPVAAGLAGALTLGLIVTDEVWRRRRLALAAKEGNI